MTTVGEHIQSTDAVICQNVDSLTDQRELLSQNVLAQLRNLVEGVAVRLQLGSADAEYNYAASRIVHFSTERRVSARLSRAQDVVGCVAVPGHSPADSWLGCIFIHRRLRRELTILPPTGSSWIAVVRWRPRPSCLPRGDRP